MNAKSIIIRDAKLTDIKAMSALLNELFSIEEDFIFDKKKQTKGLTLLLKDDRSRIFVATAKNDLIGMVTVQKVISTAEGSAVALLEDFVIKKDYRGMGIGTKMFNEVIEWTKRESLTRIQLLAEKNNIAALNFYTNNDCTTTNLICLRKI